MDRALLDRVLNQLPRISVAVVGDFFLDRYRVVDPDLEERSIETGLRAHQVVARRLFAGAGGTVANNLRSLGVGTVYCSSIIGDDGEGLELRRELKSIGVDVQRIIVDPSRLTPTYDKIMVKGPAGEQEADRFDSVNRKPPSADVEDRFIDAIGAVVGSVQAVIIADQVDAAEGGCVTPRVRGALAEAARSFPDVLFLADSRSRIGLFENMMLKPNRSEAIAAAFAGKPDAPGLARQAARELSRRTQKPVFLTRGEKGISVVAGDELFESVVIAVRGPIDICGAGDSASAGIIAALAAGAGLGDAADFGNLVASITIQQIGVTGSASPDQVRTQWHNTFGHV